MTPDELAAGMNALASAIARSRSELAAGALIDLAGLESETARLCDAAISLAAESRPAAAAGLAAVAAALDALAADLAADAARSRNAESDARRLAASGAYARPPER